MELEDFENPSLYTTVGTGNNTTYYIGKNDGKLYTHNSMTGFQELISAQYNSADNSITFITGDTLALSTDLSGGNGAYVDTNNDGNIDTHVDADTIIVEGKRGTMDTTISSYTSKNNKYSDPGTINWGSLAVSDANKIDVGVKDEVAVIATSYLDDISVIETHPAEIRDFQTDFEYLASLLNSLKLYIGQYATLQDILAQTKAADESGRTSGGTIGRTSGHGKSGGQSSSSIIESAVAATTAAATIDLEESTIADADVQEEDPVIDGDDIVSSALETAVVAAGEDVGKSIGIEQSVIEDSRFGIDHPGDYGEIDVEPGTPLYDADGNPLFDQFGNPLFVDSSISHTITGYQMDENGNITAYQIDGQYWVKVEPGTQFLLDGQMGYYIFDGNAQLDILDENGNVIGHLPAGNYAIFDVKYDEFGNVIAIKISSNGKVMWVSVTNNGELYGNLQLFGEVEELIDKANGKKNGKMLFYQKAAIGGALGALLIAAGAALVAKKKKSEDDEDDTEEEEYKLKPGNYSIYSMYENDEGQVESVQINKKKNIWVDLKK